MSGRARDALSVSRSILRTLQSTGMPTLRRSILCRPCYVLVQHLSSCVIGRYSQLAFVEVLEPKTRQFSELKPWLLNVARHHRLNSKLDGQVKAYAFLSRSSYQTSAPTVEKPTTEGFLFETDGREEIKQALYEYLELTLKVGEQLAVNISQNSPAFVDGLVEKLKLVHKDSPSDVNNSVNAAVKALLAKSKFKGVEPFLESLGVNPQKIERVSDYARSGVKGVLVKVDLLKAIGIKTEEIPKIISGNPRFLSNAQGSNQVKVEYLAELGMSPVEICKLIIQYPNSLAFVLKDGILPLVTFLKNAGVKDQDIRKVLTRCPQLLTLNVERKLLPAIERLGSVGITGSHLARVLVMQPSLLRRRLERNIAFCREFGLDTKPGILARLLVTCPNFSVEGCAQRVSYLKSIGLTQDQIVSMINKNPAFMSLNVKTGLAPKVNYFLNVIGRPLDELVTASTYLTMSLEHRIKPRHQVLAALMEAGLVSRTYSLTTIVIWSNEYFFKRFVENSPPHVAELWENHSKGTVAALDGGTIHPAAVSRPVTVQT